MESDLIGAVQLSSFSRVLLLICALTLSTAAHAQDSDLNNEQNNGVTLTAGSLPLEVVSVTSKSLQNSLLGRESYYAKNLDELYQVIGEKLAPVFDMRYVGYLVLGDYWKAADDLQRDRFVAAFSDFLIKTYAKGLLNFNQEQLVVFPATYSKDTTAVLCRSIIDYVVPVKVGVCTMCALKVCRIFRIIAVRLMPRFQRWD